MRLSHPDYIKLVFRTYQALRSTPEFSPALRQPTRASIRSECLTVYKERPDKKDEPVLRNFFGPATENNSFLDPIESFPIEGFRPLYNYLREESVKTDDKNVELLAWLIDFPHRPYWHGKEVILSESEKAILNIPKDATPQQDPDQKPSQEIEFRDFEDNPELLGQAPGIEIEVNPLPDTDEQAPDIPMNQRIDETYSDNKKGAGEIKPETIGLQKKRKWLIVGIALFFTILSTGIYLTYINNKNCMYWTGDHYEKIDCDAEVNNKVVFDEERWKDFRKITDLSTISEKSIGVVHYYGNKNREFFTCGGKHPVETTRYLKVMTRYIWEKEFGQKDSAAMSTSLDKNKKPLVNNLLK